MEGLKPSERREHFTSTRSKQFSYTKLQLLQDNQQLQQQQILQSLRGEFTLLKGETIIHKIDGRFVVNGIQQKPRGAILLTPYRLIFIWDTTGHVRN